MTKGQAPGSSQLRSALLDPALNLIFQRMRKELEDKSKALKQAQDDMAAWKFTADRYACIQTRPRNKEIEGHPFSRPF